MAQNEEELLENILSRLAEGKERNKLAKDMENIYTTLYHNLNFLELKKGTVIHFDNGHGTLSVGECKKRLPLYIAKHHRNDSAGQFSSLGVTIEIKDGTILMEESYTIFPRYGNFEHMLKFYSKQEPKTNVARRIKSLITLPEEIIKSAKERKANEIAAVESVDSLLRTSREKLFDIELFKKTYYTNPEAFKKLFETATEEQKKETVQALTRQKEENREIDKWLEEKYGEIAEYAGMEQFIEKK